MVAMNVWPTDGADGAVTSEARWRKMARQWASSGVCGVGAEMVPTLAYPNLTVKSGAAWVDGHYCELLSDQVLAVTANGLAVVRFDPAANTAELLYRDGVSTPSQNPSGTWELPIAQIAGSALTDLRRRLNPPSAGQVYGVDQYNPTLGASIALTVTTQTILTQAMPAAPAGTLLDIAMTVYHSSGVGAGPAFYVIEVNGVAKIPNMIIPDATLLMTYSARIVGIAPPVSAPYNITLRAVKTNAGGTATALATHTGLSIVSYRP